MTDELHAKEWIDEDKFKSAEKAYYKLLSNNKNPFEEMLKMQFFLQKEILKQRGQTDVEQLDTLQQKFEWLRDNKIALDDEYRELIDALPGMKTPQKERSALWKWWKEKHEVIGQHTFNDLTQEELLELKFEYIDMLHFVLNMSFALNLSAKDIFILYYYKNIENFRRIENAY